MDFRQLEMFLSVAENSSFTRASEQLYVAQSAISRQIALLEDELGEKLFKRVSKKVYLTPAGETLLRYSRRIFQEIKNATLEISGFSNLERGQIRIAAGLIAGMYLLPPALEKFKLLYPKVDLTMVTGPTETLLAKLRNNELDLGVFTLPIQSPDLEIIPLPAEEMVVVVSAKHPTLVRKKSIAPKELLHHPLILFSQAAYTRRAIDAFFREVNLTPQVLMEAENVELIKPLVRINLGITIIPLRAVREEVRRGELHYLTIQGHRLVREQGLVLHKADHIPTVVAEMIRLIQEEQTISQKGSATSTEAAKPKRGGNR